MIVVLFALVGLAAAIQGAVLFGMGRRCPTGDEKTYLRRGASDDPFEPRIFLRPPLLPWLARLTYLAGDTSGEGPARRFRIVMALVSCLTVLLVAIAAHRLGGPTAAIAAVVLMAIQPERLILGCHLWPDTLLAFFLAALLVVQTFPPSLAAACTLGVICALGVLCRIDWILVLPFVLAAWPGPFWSTQSMTALLVIAAPTILSLLLLSLFNLRRYEIFLPDTTWAFNLMVADSEVRSSGKGSFAIQGTVAGVLKTWSGAPETRLEQGVGAARRLILSPIRTTRALVRRVLTLLGPDTFIRQRLLIESVYPDLGRGSSRTWNAALALATPLLVSLCFALSAAHPQRPQAYTWPAMGLALAMVVVHTRTRYRVALFPTVCVFAAHQMQAVLTRPEGGLSLALAATAGVAVFLLLMVLRPSHEKRPVRQVG